MLLGMKDCFQREMMLLLSASGNLCQHLSIYFVICLVFHISHYHIYISARNYFIQRKYALIFPSRSNITTLVLVSQGLVSSPSTFAFSLAQWYHLVALLWWIVRLWRGFVARLVSNLHLSRIMTKPTKWHVRPAKTQISLGIRPVWSESSLSAWRNLGSLATQKVHSKVSNWTGRIPRLIWVFLLCTATLLALSWGSSFMLISILLNVC